MILRKPLFLAAILVTSLPVSAQQADSAGLDLFEKKIRPLLVDTCYKCHSAKSEKLKAGLYLDSHDGMVAGGDSGPALVPGNPDKSLIIKAVRWTDKDLQMPPKTKLPDSAIADLTQWVKMGAPWPKEAAPIAAGAPKGAYAVDYDKLRKEHWAYQPISHPAVPSVKNAAWPKSDIDRFVLAKMEEKGLAPNGPADKLSLLRRVNFDLTGLPPSAAEIQSFLNDNSPTAYEKVVDRLLATPAFGECWGRHWLDLARYAESTGMARNYPYPHAWRYRDYVIDSFNADKPFNEFIAEQIAGDLLPSSNPKEHNEHLVATGFLAVGTRDLNEQNKLQYQMDNLDEQIDCLSKSILATTISCARCHDHKFDPIPQSDYYSMAGIFRSTDTLTGLVNRKGKADRVDDEALARLDGDTASYASPEDAKKAKDLQERLDHAQAKLKELQQYAQIPPGKFQKYAGRGGFPATQNALRQQIIAAHATVNSLTAELKALKPQGSAAAPSQLAMGARDDSRPTNCNILIRGEVDKPDRLVQRGFISLIPASASLSIGSRESGRLQLAQWLTSSENPLTSRVIVNRIWRHLFGAGIVRTVDNFGSTGEKPSHPELLDYLATRFTADDNWSFKKMIREIVLSQVYQLDSKPVSANMGVDPDNRMIWRMAPRRLEAEAIRDSMLAISGKLDLTRPADSPVAHVNPNELRNVNAGRFDQDQTHRSAYLPIVRGLVPEMLDVFDFAEPSLVTGSRDTTTVPTQALFLMNNPFVIQQAQALAQRLLKDSTLSDASRVDMAYKLALTRAASPAERSRAMSYIESQMHAAPVPGGRHDPNSYKVDAWASFCQALFASAEFRYTN